MRTPFIFEADQIKKWNVQTEVDGVCTPARPESFYGLNLKLRFVAAWNVLTGKWDAIRWRGQ